MFTDTHTHIFKQYFDNLPDILKKIEDSGVHRIINNGCNRNENEEVMEMVNTYDIVYGALGIHPESVEEYTEEDIKYIEEHINSDKIVAVGEIGLDYHYTKDNKDKQIELFERQLDIAEKYNKPVIIHSRECTDDMINILKRHHNYGTIHAFSGSYETAMIYIKLGYKLGINGVVTFKNAKLIDTLKRLPLDSIVLETDSPYLTPVPFRGEKNDSSHIIDIAKYISDNKGVSMEELSKVTEDTVNKVYKM